MKICAFLAEETSTKPFAEAGVDVDAAVVDAGKLDVDETVGVSPTDDENTLSFAEN